LAEFDNCPLAKCYWHSSSAGFRWWGPGAQAWWEASCTDTDF